MMTFETASRILEEKVQKGGILVVAGHADLPSIKRLLEDCLQEDIPAVLGPCAAGG